jgi:enoyl-CoA hydratase/carnithine racemase
MDDNAELLCERSEGIVRVKLNRPAKRNALSFSLLSSLETTLSEISRDPSARVVILSANGPAFCAGHDLGEMVGLAEADYRRLFESCTRVMQTVRKMPQPVIARVHGIATAAGCQLVATCDLAVAAKVATFATPGVRIGLFCTTPMVPLVRAIPAKAAMEMLLTGQPISADRALQLGLVNQVVEPEELDAAADRMASAIVASSPLIVRIGKRAFYEQIMLSEGDAYAKAVEVMTVNAGCQDAQEGMQAFLGKRPPRWTGT